MDGMGNMNEILNRYIFHKTIHARICVYDHKYTYTFSVYDVSNTAGQIMIISPT